MYPLDTMDLAHRRRFACGRPDKLVRSVEPSVPQQRGGVSGAKDPVAAGRQLLWQAVNFVGRVQVWKPAAQQTAGE